MKKRQPFNYIYFGILFIILSLLHIFHIFLVKNATAVDRTSFIVHAIGQCAIEVGALIVLAHLLGQWFPKRIKTVYIVLTFLLFLFHIIDFPLMRLTGMSIWYTLKFVAGESFENLVELLYATNISMMSWIMAGLAGVLIPFLGILLYRKTANFARKKPVFFSYSTLAITLFSAAVFLSIFDFKGLKPEDEQRFLSALPWKATFLSRPDPELKVAALPSKPGEEAYLFALQGLDLKVRRKPNIFLFVVESLREDFVTPEITPFLANFKDKNISFQHGLAAANGTNLSWFSIFHSVYPFYWGAREPSQWQHGSLPLQILKKAGYQVHVYSAARLGYYHMGERLFGKGQYLADTLKVFNGDNENHENDTECMKTLLDDLNGYPEGHLFIVFLESTHFGYSWPEQKSSMDYLKLTCSNDRIEDVKDRYRNAFHFVDGLFGQFFETLKSHPEGKKSVVVVTGDHGEEFFEQGRIFHASHLSAMQTHVPIYYRLGSKSFRGSLTSHLDIFPTILHHVMGKDQFEHWFDGESILRPRKKNFAVSTRINWSRDPYEFLIHNGESQLVARFSDKTNVLKSQTLQIISHRDENNEPLDIQMDRIQQDFKKSLETLFISN